MDKRRIGAYGGTFDPIHNGHIDVARQVVWNFRLDSLLVIPAHRPPHKTMRSISDSYHRYAMTVLATLDDPKLAVSTIELEAPDKPYTFETIERLCTGYAEGAELYFVMGSDSFGEVLSWREPARILESASWIIAARPGHDVLTNHLPDFLQGRVIDLRGGLPPSIDALVNDKEGCWIYLTDYVCRDISSTRIRQMVTSEQSIEHLVPTAVANYIEKYQLYRH